MTGLARLPGLRDLPDALVARDVACSGNDRSRISCRYRPAAEGGPGTCACALAAGAVV